MEIFNRNPKCLIITKQPTSQIQALYRKYNLKLAGDVEVFTINLTLSVSNSKLLVFAICQTVRHMRKCFILRG